MSSFQALLSTALSGSYSQGLIHRKTIKRLFQSAKKHQRGFAGDKEADGGKCAGYCERT
jgi:hypothetical protein